MEIHFVLSTIPKFRLCFRKIFNDFVDLTHIWLSTYCERAFERTYQYVEQILVWIRQSPPPPLHQLPIRNCLFAIRLIDLNDWMNLLQKPDEIFSWNTVLTRQIRWKHSNDSKKKIMYLMANPSGYENPYCNPWAKVWLRNAQTKITHPQPPSG